MHLPSHPPFPATGRRAAVIGLACTAATCGAVGPAVAAATSAPSSVQHVAAAPAAASSAVTYRGEVVSPSGLSIRFGPTTTAKVVGALPYRAVVSIQCKVVGQTVDGNALWYKIANTTGEWVTARYVENLGAAPGYC